MARGGRAHVLELLEVICYALLAMKAYVLEVLLCVLQAVGSVTVGWANRLETGCPTE